MITVADRQLDIDVLDELEQFMDQFPKAQVRDEKMQSCSPFRNESHPSFAVNLVNGSWIDSGASDEYRKGHFIQLLSFLRCEMAEDTVSYLLNKYSIEKLDTDSLTVDMSWLHPKPQPKIFFTEDLQPYAYRSPYLATRGISEEVQRAFRIGYDREKQAVMMPWMDRNSHVINLKFRAVNSKRFWYAKGGQSLKHHLYCLHKVIEQNITEIWLVESEIDALRLWSNGIPAVAFGTANCSKYQEKLLLTSCVESIVIAVDNDGAGERFKQNLISRFTGKLDINEIQFPDKTVKDIGEMTDQQIIFAEINKIKSSIKLNIAME